MNTKTIGAMLCAVSMAAFADVEKNTDQGQQIAVTAQENAAGATADKFVDAETQVKATLKKLGLHDGYIEEKKAILAIGTAYYTTKDPLNDKKFVFMRGRKALEAYLDAKRSIIESIMTQFSAMDTASVVSDEGDDSAFALYQQKQDAFRAKRAEFSAKFKAEFEKDAPAEVVAFESAPIDENFANVLSALSVWMEHWSAKDGLPEEKKAKITEVLAGLKADLSALTADYKALDAEAKKIRETPVAGTESSVTMLSKMPLLGSSVVTQSESWDKTKGKYQISMAVVWSRKMQEQAKAAATGDPIPSEKKGKYDFNEWIEKQDLSCMIGPRRFVDKDGNTVYVGIAARDFQVADAKKRGVKRSATTDAASSVMFSLVGDVMSYTEAKSASKEFVNPENEEDVRYATSEKLADTITQKISKLNISGITPGGSGEFVHPLAGRNMYVEVRHLEPELAKDGLEILKKLYADAAIVRNVSKYRGGVHAGAEKALNDVRNSQKEFNRGKADGEKAVKDEVEKDLGNRAAKRIKAAVQGAQGSGAKAKRNANGGVVTGDNDIDTDF